MIGVDPLAENPGAGEKDSLTGGQDGDIFALGDANHVYYTASGKCDYARITDFQIGEDQIQLHGEASDYILAPYRLGCSYATGIYLKGSDNGCGYGSRELIGVVQNICPNQLSLSDPSQFIYAGGQPA